MDKKAVISEIMAVFGVLQTDSKTKALYIQTNDGNKILLSSNHHQERLFDEVGSQVIVSGNYIKNDKFACLTVDHLEVLKSSKNSEVA